MTNTITFKGQVITLEENPRKEVCNRCRYVVGTVHPITGKVYQRSHMHHETYNPNDVLADTIETCPVCHGETRRKQESDLAPIRKQLKLSGDVYQDLTDKGKKNETYSQIIRRLIDEHKVKQEK